jgi:hypothetical protein
LSHVNNTEIITPQEVAAYYAEKAILAYKNDGSYYSGAFFVGYISPVKNVDYIEYFKLIIKEYPLSINGILKIQDFIFYKDLNTETKEWLEKMSLLQ